MWIDVDSSLKKDLFFHLKKYLWKKQVELVDVEKEEDSHKPSVFVGFVNLLLFRITCLQFHPLLIEECKFKEKTKNAGKMSMQTS